MRLHLLIFPALVACGGGFEAFTWSSKAPLPIPRTDLALASLGGNLYAIGGYSGSTLARLDQYAPDANTWTQKASLLSARREFAAGVMNDKIYVACGMAWTDPNAVTYVMTTEEYDPVADRWSARAQCPMPQAFNSVYGNVHIAGAAVNGRLYALVYNTNINSAAAMYEFDPLANAWTTKSPPPFSYATYAATELGGQLYLAASGNLGGGGPPATNFARYDPATDTWVIRASLFGIWGSALASANGKVYALGGVGATRSGAGAASANVNEYDPVTDKWTAAGRFGSARHSAGASLLGHDLYVAGGAVPASGYGLQPVANLEIGVPRPK